MQDLLSSASYRQADQNIDFLARNDVRSTRLQLDFLKTQLLLKEHGIEHTIVVYGSTRIVEPAAANQRVLAFREALEQSPDSKELQKNWPSQSVFKQKVTITMLPVNLDKF